MRSAEWAERWREGRPVLAALLAGIVGTPLIVLTLPTMPVVVPVLLYGTISFFFGYLLPRPSWRWGCWLTLGIPLALVAAILLGIAQPPAEEPPGLSIPYSSLFGLMFILGMGPALAGSVVGGLLGSRIGRRQPHFRERR